MDDRSNFKTAVHQLYHSSNESDRKPADKWLEQWQTQPVAWQTADSILHDQTCTEEEKYFAAHTLRTKVNSIEIALGFGNRVDILLRG